MPCFRRIFGLALLSSAALVAQPPEAAIRKVLTDQVAAWNRGDIDGFMVGYANSPETAFVGKTLQRGWEAVRRNYRERYPTKDAMGKLDFEKVEVKLLGEGYATVIGHFHLERTAAGGGKASGIFTLLFQRTAAGWRIIQDHTS